MQTTSPSTSKLQRQNAIEDGNWSDFETRIVDLLLKTVTEGYSMVEKNANLEERCSEMLYLAAREKLKFEEPIFNTLIASFQNQCRMVMQPRDVFWMRSLQATNILTDIMDRELDYELVQPSWQNLFIYCTLAVRLVDLKPHYKNSVTQALCHLMYRSRQCIGGRSGWEEMVQDASKYDVQ